MKKKPKHSIHPDLEALAKPVESLELDEQNARTHSAANLDAIERSYREHGQRKPLVAQRKGDRLIIRAGNGQLEAARDRLGWTHIAVIVVDEDDEAALRFALRDNRSAELAEWSRELPSLLESLPDPTDLGWDEAELAHLLPEMPESGDGGGVTTVRMDMGEPTFWITIHGSLKDQEGTLETVRNALGSMEGLHEELGITTRKGWR